MKKKVSKKSKTAKKSAQSKQIKRMKARSAFQPITKDMGFSEVLQRFPQTVPVFSKYGMHCIGCSMSAFETIEQGAIAHGIDVKKFVEDLNKAASNK